MKLNEHQIEQLQGLLNQLLFPLSFAFCVLMAVGYFTDNFVLARLIPLLMLAIASYSMGLAWPLRKDVLRRTRSWYLHARNLAFGVLELSIIALVARYAVEQPPLPDIYPAVLGFILDAIPPLILVMSLLYLLHLALGAFLYGCHDPNADAQELETDDQDPDDQTTDG